jgi:uncharacterized OB-fold protein
MSDAPRPVHWDEEFWRLSSQGVLSAQRCLECSHLQHYPRPACGRCLSTDRVWHHLSGKGTIYSFTIVRRPAGGSPTGDAPFTLVDVLLDEGIRMLSRLVSEPTDSRPADSEPHIEDRVSVVFQPAPNGLYLPYFTLRREA